MSKITTSGSIFRGRILYETQEQFLLGISFTIGPDQDRLKNKFSSRFRGHRMH